MNPTHYLLRAPLVGPSQHVMGYRLSWQNQNQDPKKNPQRIAQPGVTGGRELLALLADCPEKAESGLYFVQADAATLSSVELQRLKPENTVLMFDQAQLVDAGAISAAMSLNAQGFGLGICDADFASLKSSDGLISLMTHAEFDVENPDLAEISRFAKLVDLPVSVMVRKVADWQSFDACAALGLKSFFPDLCISPHQLQQPVVLGPQTVLIMQLMQMVQNNADVRELEKVLQRDATLSYKLLHYINSASFGIEVEIESIRHAVTMLGYTPLYRWLSLLLAKTSKSGFSPALLQASIIRGRFVELLGARMLSKNEAGNLFVVGLFSLLQQLLGVPLQQVMRQISLPQAIVQALLSREGVYGPFLALAEACELENGSASVLADALFMTPAQVNQAHLSALVWTQNLRD